MHFCNASVRSGVPLTQLLSPSVPPYYGVIFLREERPLTPEVLTHWAETLSQPLFGQPFSCRLGTCASVQENGWPNRGWDRVSAQCVSTSGVRGRSSRRKITP